MIIIFQMIEILFLPEISDRPALGSPDSDHVTILIFSFGGISSTSTIPMGQQKQWRRGPLPSEYVLQLVLTPSVSNPASSYIFNDHLICFRCM